MKQALIKRLQGDVVALSKLKKKGLKVGRIKFVKAVHSIPLTQYGVAHWVKKDKGVHVQGIGNFKGIWARSGTRERGVFYGKPRRKERGGTTTC